jgi:hydrogenase-4 component B
MSSLLAALAILLGSGTLALATRRWPRLGLAVATAGVVAASGAGLGPALAVLRGGAGAELTFFWAVPVGTMRLGLDPLTAFFLVPVLGLASPCAVYGASYLSRQHRRWLGPQACFFNVTVAAMMMVLLARDGVVLLIAWEVMTIASYLLVSFEHEQAEVRRAGWVYLVAGHVGVACLFALVLTLGSLAGDFGFGAFAARAPTGGALAVLVCLLAAVGFGVKAGVVPLHGWLPEAHAAAPSHGSALMSGALIELGLYGLLRVSTFLRPAPWWGPSLIVVGLGSGLFAISVAAYQRDIKRALAYSSIENMGIVLVGLGLGFWGASHGHPRIGALGIYGALLHVWNHAAIKGLLFLCAGSVLAGAGSRDLERLGGVLRRMPWTGTLMILAAVAIAGLPPLNAFASEWLIYLGLLGGGMEASSGAGLLLWFVSAGLALMGALAALCFVRLIGVGFLGRPRSGPAAEARESGVWMLVPMAVLGVALAAMSAGATRLVSFLARPARQLLGAAADTGPGVAAAQLRPIAAASMALCGALLGAAVALALMLRRSRSGGRRAADDTWGCGYLAPTARMQYTGASFAEILVVRLMPSFLRARISSHRPTSLLAEPGSFSLDGTDPLTRSTYEPLFDRWARRFARLRWLQQGVLHAYLGYILVVVVAALAWASARRWWWGGA